MVGALDYSPMVSLDTGSQIWTTSKTTVGSCLLHFHLPLERQLTHGS